MYAFCLILLMVSAILGACWIQGPVQTSLCLRDLQARCKNRRGEQPWIHVWVLEVISRSNEPGLVNLFLIYLNKYLLCIYVFFSFQLELFS